MSRKAKTKGTTVTIPILVKPVEGGSPFRCKTCQQVVYHHGSGKFWCEECGEFRSRDQVKDLREAIKPKPSTGA